MSGLVFDEDVMDRKDFRRLKGLVVQRLERAELDCEDLILEFEKSGIL